jgi:hypothetical protein
VAADVKIIMGRWQREQISQMAEVIAVETVRLDRALNAIWDKVLAGDRGAINTMLKIMERRTRLLGLDAPHAVDLTSEGQPVVVKVLRGVSMDDL